MNLHETALYYMRHGYGVLPVGPDKRPLLPWKELQERYLSEGEVADWWGGQPPRALLAILTGPISGGLACLDIDNPALAERLMQDVGLRAETTLVRTPRGGLHIYVMETGGPSKSGPLVPGVADLKAEGGYVLAPPSRTPAGAYKIVAANRPMSVDKAREWALELLKAFDVEPAAERQPLYKEALKQGAKVLRGSRNMTLTSLAGKVRHNLKPDEGLNLLQIFNRSFDPPLADDEVLKIANSVWSYGGDHNLGLDIVCLASVEPEQVKWLWYPRIPFGKLTVMAGPPGAGKSTLLLDIAARVTRGAPLPLTDERAPQGPVLLLTAEDGLADTVRPRIDRAGGDPRLVHVVRWVRTPEGEQWFSLAEHLSLLEAAIVEHKPLMVIIDPVLAYTGKADTHKASEVRGMLAPVATVAEQQGIAFLGVMHLNKRSTDVNVLNRITAAQDFTAAPRVVMLVARDPQDQEKRRRVLCTVKNNVGVEGPALTFHFAEDAGLIWDRAVTMEPSELLLAPPTKEETVEMQAAREFLEAELAGGIERMATEMTRVAKEQGIASSTLRRARDAIGIVPYRSGFGPGGRWFWRLPQPETEEE